MTAWKEMLKPSTYGVRLSPLAWHNSHALWGYAIYQGIMDATRIQHGSLTAQGLHPFWAAAIATLFAIGWETRDVIRSRQIDMDNIADLVQRNMWHIPAAALDALGTKAGWSTFAVFFCLYLATLPWSKP